MIFQRFRDEYFSLRQNLRFFYFRNHVEREWINLGGLRAACDVVLDIPLYKSPRIMDWRKLNELKIRQYYESPKRLIFVNFTLVKYFETFLELIKREFHGTFIIDPHDTSIDFRPQWVGSLARWSAPNLRSPRESDGLLIPLGLEDARRGTNTRKTFFRENIDKTGYILLGPFANTNARRKYLASIKDSSVITLYVNRLPPKRYDQLSSSHRFVVCPQGNGIDTHRFWETLVRRSIPIVEKSDWSLEFSDLGIPILLVNDFREISEFDSVFLSDFYIKSVAKLVSVEYKFTNAYWLTKLLKTSI